MRNIYSSYMSALNGNFQDNWIIGMHTAKMKHAFCLNGTLGIFLLNVCQVFLQIYAYIYTYVVFFPTTLFSWIQLSLNMPIYNWDVNRDPEEEGKKNPIWHSGHFLNEI